MSRSFWVRKGGSELIDLIYYLGHGYYWVHISWNIGWQLLTTLHLKLHLLKFLVLVIVHHGGARSNRVCRSRPVLIGKTWPNHTTISHLTLPLIDLALQNRLLNAHLRWGNAWLLAGRWIDYFCVWSSGCRCGGHASTTSSFILRGKWSTSFATRWIT